MTLTHDAFIYGSPEEFVDTASPFLRAGLRSGEAAVAVTTQTNLALLEQSLEPGEEVLLIDADDWYQRPLDTIAQYRELLDDCLARGAPSARIIGEVRFGQDPEMRDEWINYESALNRSFEDAPAWIVCPYDRTALPDDVLRTAGRTHPYLQRAGTRSESPDYVPPEQFLERSAPEHPLLGTPPMLALSVNHALPLTRRRLRATAIECGLDAHHADRFVLAVNELVSNSIRHGGGQAIVRLWRRHADVVCEVSDDGPGLADPVAGYIPPTAARPNEGQMGLWLARNLSDGFTLVPRAGGATVLLRFRLTPDPATPSTAAARAAYR